MRKKIFTIIINTFFLFALLFTFACRGGAAGNISARSYESTGYVEHGVTNSNLLGKNNIDVYYVGSSKSSWATEFKDRFFEEKNLQLAIDTAASSKKQKYVFIQQGIYIPTSTPNPVNEAGNKPRNVHFSLRNNVTVIGGYAGYEKDGVPKGGETILSGDLKNNDVIKYDSNGTATITKNEDNAYHVFFHPEGTDLNSTAILKNVTIRGGNASEQVARSSSTAGGGMYNDGSSPKLIGCKFVGNMAQGSGGGMYNNINKLTLLSCTFENNWALTGGGMYNDECELVISDCVFTGNTSYDGAGSYMTSPGYGGGMYNYYCKLSATGCKFVGNTSADRGGGMYNHRSDSVVKLCVFERNKAHISGGIETWGGKVTITDCKFIDNITGGGAGGVSFWDAKSTIKGCEFTGNKAGTSGGGIYIDESKLAVKNCIFTNNISHKDGDNSSRSGGGGGIYCEKSKLTITGCNFTGNATYVVGYGGGGGIYSEQSTLTLKRCTFTSNTAARGGGGGCAFYGCHIQLFGCTFTGNNAYYSGGGIKSYVSRSLIVNCKITENTSINSGGGIHSQKASINSGGGIHSNLHGETLIDNSISKNVPDNIVR